ncbi:MAG: IMP dehydrogenase [Verrucomicrobiales bacterium]
MAMHSYPTAKEFFEELGSFAVTYDDVSLATCYSQVLPRQAKAETRLSESLILPLPIISADMDTVTEAEMAIALALNGGLGLIHYNMAAKQQVKQVTRVKNHVNGLIQDPISVHPDQSIGEVLEMVESRGFDFRTFPVVDEKGTLLGLLPSPVVRGRYADRQVAAAMTQRAQVLTIQADALGEDPIQAADQFFSQHLGIHKLPVVDREDRLRGMFTLSDVERISEEATAHTRPARDSRFRLRCGAAVSAPRTTDGTLDRDALLEHVGAMVDEGLDVAAVSTAHGHTQGVGDCVRWIRNAFPDLVILAGNVTSAEGVDFLYEAGADAVKVGQGPGSICTTRVVAGVGVPQMTALYHASKAENVGRVAIIADGGISKSGDVVKALTLADAVVCGGLLAGAPEAPGKILEIEGKLYKEYRGMGSQAAMNAGSAARYGHTRGALKVAAEGVEALKEVSPSVHVTLRQLVGGLQSGMGYLGAKDLQELKAHARYVRVSPAGQREAQPHDVLEIKAPIEKD